MRSLKRTLAAWTATLSILLTAAAGLSLYLMVRAQLLEQFDGSLLSKARLLASTIEIEHGGLDLGFRDMEMNEFDSRRAGGYLHVIYDGRTVYRSPTLGDGDWLISHLDRADGRVHALKLPGGRAGRGVVLRFTPKRDPEEDGQATARIEGVRAGTVALYLVRDVEEPYEMLGALRAALIVIGLLLAVSMIVATRVVVGRALRPVDALAGAVGGVDEATLDRAIEVPHLPSELEPIVEQFNGLMARLQTAFERERSFSADLAHELRTPLAGLRTTIDVALAQPRDAEAYRQALGQLHEITEQMSVLVSALLHLAKLERGIVSPSFEPVDVDALIRSTWRALKQGQPDPIRLSEQVTLSADGEIETDVGMLTLAIRNVLHNALGYVDADGTVSIETHGTAAGIKVRVANTGSTIDSDCVGRVFDRFWRGDRARTGTGVRFGLGLALTRQAIEAVGGSVIAQSQKGGQFLIMMSVPDHARSAIHDEY